MAKRKRKSKSRPARPARRARPPAAELQKTLTEAERLVGRGRHQQAIDMLEPLLDSYPRVAELHYLLGYAHAQAGHLWAALDGYERARELSRDPGYWLPLASLYGELGMRVHALNAFRQVLRHPPDETVADSSRQLIDALEQDLAAAFPDWVQARGQVEKGVREMEAGNRALQNGDFAGCIAANRRAIQILGDWPPPHNNLSLALFFHGQPEDAVAAARGVLAQDPDNIQALSNAIRFLAWTGREAEAEAVWQQLAAVEASDADDRLKKAEAAAVLDKDQAVYDLLRPFSGSRDTGTLPPGLLLRGRVFLAVAEANLGRRGAARRRLKPLRSQMHTADAVWEALRAGQNGLGWSDRFPYFTSTELLPINRIEEFIDLVSREKAMGERRYRQAMDRFVAQFPHVVLMGEKVLWEDMQPEAGVGFLINIGTPRAYDALRRFGLSQAGDDQDRMDALHRLAEVGQIAADEPLHVWLEGEWRDILIRQYEITEELEVEYSDEVAELLNAGLEANQAGQLARAEQLFERALKLEPRAKQALNNLGAIYAARGEHERAKEVLRAALEIDPLYIHPRCNLAHYLLDEDDVEGAVEMLKPLGEVTRFHPRDMAVYSFTQGRILVAQEKYDAARGALEAALKMWPDYEPAQNLLNRLDATERLRKMFGTRMEQLRNRDVTYRQRLQGKLTSLDPALASALTLHTKDALTGTARAVIRGGGWSTLKKAGLADRIASYLLDPDDLAWVVQELPDGARQALAWLLDEGGYAPWEDFDEAYDNDLDESRYWNYHTPETVMGRLRLCGLLCEATVDGEVWVAVPVELRPLLEQLLD